MSDSIVNIKINGKSVQAKAGQTILEASHDANFKIPFLCKHPDLQATASCGICVVKVKGSANLVRACAAPIAEGMEITTQDPELMTVRRTVLELILSAHPNECLTCGRNGSCELQRLAEEFGIRRDSLPKIVPDLPKDDSTKTIVLEPRKCIKCGRCIEVCQDVQNVWALSFLERGLDTRISPAGDITLADSPCIRCGQCSAHCPVGAIYEYDETLKVWDALRNPKLHKVAQIAPAVRVAIGEAFGLPPGTNMTGQLYAALRELGFDAVFDTNFGADVTIMEEASEFAARLGGSHGKLPLITTCCPSWVDFMEKFHPELIPHFSSCKSPHAIVGVLAKTYYARKKGLKPEDVYVVSIMPCTSKKFEVKRGSSMFASGVQDVDVSITTREFARMVKQSGLDLTGMDPEAQPDSPLGEYTGAGVIFGASGGVMEAALRTAAAMIEGKEPDNLEFAPIRGLEGVKTMKTTVAGKEIRIAVAHGLRNVESVMESVKKAEAEGQEPPWHFIEVMACPGGCVGGGGQGARISDSIRRRRSEGLYADDRAKKARCSHQNPAVKKVYEEFLGKPLGEQSMKLLHTSYTPLPLYRR